MYDLGFLPKGSLLKKLLWLKAVALSAASAIIKTVTGSAPITLTNAVSHAIHSLTQYGLCTQSTTPTPSAPVDIVCNNGALKVRRQSGLPLGYQMVEWLISAGAIPITGFKTKSTQEITTVFYRDTSVACYLYSSDTSTSGTTNTTAYLTSTGGNWRWDGKTLAPSVITGSKMTSVQSANGLYFNGNKWGSYDGGEFVSTNDLSVSSTSNTGTRIYSMTIREGDEVTLDLVPVQRVTDNAYGFYDKVSGEFYTNADATFDAGDPIDDPVEIYTDGTPEVLTVSGKNLLDQSQDVALLCVGATGREYAVGPLYGHTAFIPVKPNTAYTWSGLGSVSAVAVYRGAMYSDASFDSFVSNINGPASSTSTFTTTADTRFVVLNVQVADETQQLELGSTATDYEPFVTPQTVTNLPMLLSVGDYKDELELVSGHADRAITVFRASPDMNWALATGTGYKQFYTTDTQGQLKNSVSCMSNIAPYGCTASNRASYQHGCYTGGTGNLCFQMIGEASINTVDDWKDFLRVNGAYVVAAKATETTEQTTPHSLHTSEGTNVVDVTSNVDPVTLTCEYKGVEE